VKAAKPVDINYNTDFNPMANTFFKDERLAKGDFRGIKWKKFAETPHFLLLVYGNDKGQKKIWSYDTKKNWGGSSQEPYEKTGERILQAQQRPVPGSA